MLSVFAPFVGVLMGEKLKIEFILFAFTSSIPSSKIMAYALYLY